MAGAMFMVIISGEIIRAVALLGAARIVRYRYAITSARDSTHAVVLVEFDDLEKAKSTLRKGQKITATLVPHGSPGG